MNYTYTTRKMLLLAYLADVHLVHLASMAYLAQARMCLHFDHLIPQLRVAPKLTSASIFGHKLQRSTFHIIHHQP